MNCLSLRLLPGLQVTSGRRASDSVPLMDRELTVYPLAIL